MNTLTGNKAKPHLLDQFIYGIEVAVKLIIWTAIIAGCGAFWWFAIVMMCVGLGG